MFGDLRQLPTMVKYYVVQLAVDSVEAVNYEINYKKLSYAKTL